MKKICAVLGALGIACAAHAADKRIIIDPQFGVHKPICKYYDQDCIDSSRSHKKCTIPWWCNSGVHQIDRYFGKGCKIYRTSGVKSNSSLICPGDQSSKKYKRIVYCSPEGKDGKNGTWVNMKNNLWWCLP